MGSGKGKVMRQFTLVPVLLAVLAAAALAGDDEGHPVKIEKKDRTEEETKQHEAEVKTLVRELMREKNKVMLLSRISQFGEAGGEVERDALILFCRASKNQEQLDAAFLALAEMGGAESLNFLCSKYALKSNSDWVVQRSACKALRELGDPRAACCLIDVIEDRRQKTMVVGACLITLAKVAPQDEAAIETIFRMADTKDDIVRSNAMTALGYLASPRSFEVLADRARHEQNGEVRGAACTALGIHGSRAGVAVLREVIEKDHALQVKDAAMRALKELGESR